MQFCPSKKDALKIQQEIEAVLQKHGAYYSVTYENKPDLRMIRFNEISIKVFDKQANIKQ